MSEKWTLARRQAMTVMATTDQEAAYARYSNETNEIRGLVYWQSADWLIDQGLIRREGIDQLELTEAGRAYLEEQANPDSHGNTDG